MEINHIAMILVMNYIVLITGRAKYRSYKLRVNGAVRDHVMQIQAQDRVAQIRNQMQHH